MPTFSVTLVRTLEESCRIEVTAKNAEAAEAKVQKSIDADTFDWEKFTAETDISVEENVVIDQVDES